MGNTNAHIREVTRERRNARLVDKRRRDRRSLGKVNGFSAITFTTGDHAPAFMRTHGGATVGGSAVAERIRDRKRRVGRRELVTPGGRPWAQGIVIDARK